MRKLIIIAVSCIAVLLTSCEYSKTAMETPSEDVTEIIVPAGKRVVSIASSGTILYFMTEEMDSDYVPKRKCVYAHRHDLMDEGKDFRKAFILVESKKQE